MPRHLFAAMILGLGLSPGSAPAQQASLTPQQSGTTHRLQAVGAVSEKVAWLSGTGGTWARTMDGGGTWTVGQVPGADSLEFRDVHAVDASTAWLLAAGPGDRSRIYHTSDGGLTWILQFTNPLPDAFFDCLAFWDARSAIAVSDNVGGTLPVLMTRDGGAHWTWLSDPATPAGSPLPPASEGEGAFAASGTCLTARRPGMAWIATGAGKTARVLRTRDRGAHWESATTPILQGTSTSGHTSVAFRDGRHGVAVGGDIGSDDRPGNRVVASDDGGATWNPAGQPPFAGAIYGAVYVPGAGATVVAVGPKGAAWSRDDGRTWAALDTLSYWSAGFAGRKAGWLVGPGGRVVRVELKGLRD
jgi:photosystem II stability/assembly factor-like uncharacterized protein